MKEFFHALVILSGVFLGVLCICGLGWFVFVVILPLGWAVIVLFISLVCVLVGLMSLFKAQW
jgi:hypothetical protein